MKWNILVGSVVLGASLCGQSFGGDLLHRLLGGNGCGARSSCCDTSVCDPSCGAEMAGPSCGAEIAACGPCGAGAGPSCGVEVAACDPCGAPSCGVEAACCDPCGTTVCVRTPVLDKLRNLKAKMVVWKNSLHARSSCCDPCGAPTCGAEIASCDPCGAPTCGAEIAACDPCGAPACDSGCGIGRRHGGLFSKLFKHKSCCDSIACDAAPCSSCNGSAPAAAPAAPAPAPDEHAYMNTNRRVIQTSTRVR